VSAPRRGRNPVCRRCRKAPATVNAYCGACYDVLYPPVTMTESRLAEAWAGDQLPGSDGTMSVARANELVRAAELEARAALEAHADDAWELVRAATLRRELVARYREARGR
jgi:hypothetical protein